MVSGGNESSQAGKARRAEAGALRRLCTSQFTRTIGAFISAQDTVVARQ